MSAASVMVRRGVETCLQMTKWTRNHLTEVDWKDAVIKGVAVTVLCKFSSWLMDSWVGGPIAFTAILLFSLKPKPENRGPQESRGHGGSRMHGVPGVDEEDMQLQQALLASRQELSQRVEVEQEPADIIAVLRTRIRELECNLVKEKEEKAKITSSGDLEQEVSHLRRRIQDITQESQEQERILKGRVAKLEADLKRLRAVDRFPGAKQSNSPPQNMAKPEESDKPKSEEDNAEGFEPVADWNAT